MKTMNKYVGQPIYTFETLTLIYKWPWPLPWPNNVNKNYSVLIFMIMWQQIIETF